MRRRLTKKCARITASYFAEIRITAAGECDGSDLPAGDLTRPPNGGRRARRLHRILDDEVTFLGAPDGEGDMIGGVCYDPDLPVASRPLDRLPLSPFRAS